MKTLKEMEEGVNNITHYLFLLTFSILIICLLFIGLDFLVNILCVISMS